MWTTNPDLGKIAWKTLVFGLLACSLTPFKLAGAGEPETFYSVLTNCPPIKRLVLGVQYYSPQMTLIEFRYQPGAFYARQLMDGELSEGFPPTPKDTSGGYWGSDYWYVQPASPGRPHPTLTTGVETHRNKLRNVNNMFERFFSLFASFGITPEGVDSVRIEGDQLIAVMNQGDPRQEHTYTAVLALSNALPIHGLLQPQAQGNILPHPFQLKYVYDTNSVPLPFPSQIIQTIRVPKAGQPEDADLAKFGEDKIVLHLVVRGIELAGPGSLLPQEAFRPDLALLGSNYHHLVITNGQLFQQRGAKLTPMDETHNKLPRGHSELKRWPFLCFVVTACILPIILVRSFRRKSNQQ
jgi:hypothetical protein